jgi:hypothetical protein
MVARPSFSCRFGALLSSFETAERFPVRDLLHSAGRVPGEGHARAVGVGFDISVKVNFP